MKKRWILLSAFCASAISHAQVGIGTATPNPSSQLEISSDKRGILIPQVTLKNLTDNKTISNGNVESLLVYNTAASEQLQPGYYFWKQNTWTRLLTEIDDKVVDFPIISKFVVEEELLKLYDTHNNFVVIDLEKLNVITTLVKDASGNGQYTYTNEAGTPVVIDVKADVISNFETIINTTEVQDIINNIIKTVGGNVYYDGSSFTYINEDGDTVSLDISSVVKANETLTTLVNVNDVFTYTSENSTATEINIPSLVKDHETLTTLENVKTQETEESGEVIDIYTLTYKDENGNLNPIDIKVLVKGSETLTTLVYDPIAHVLTYTNEKGEETILKLTDLVGDGESLTKLEFDASTNSLLYTDEKQIIHTIDLETINKHPWYDSATQKVATSNTSDIYTRGWVGIGFTEPSNAPNEKLRVNGSITAVNSYYADYVFENYFDGYSALKYDYKFKELDDIADFIRENRHLPGITPIHELKKTEEGYAINVSELSVQLLEKTEELYLHMIEQNNELEQKEARIKELETLNREVLKKINLLEEKETKINELEMINKMFYQKLEQLEQELLELKSKN